MLIMYRYKHSKYKYVSQIHINLIEGPVNIPILLLAVCTWVPGCCFRCISRKPAVFTFRSKTTFRIAACCWRPVPNSGKQFVRSSHHLCVAASATDSTSSLLFLATCQFGGKCMSFYRAGLGLDDQSPWRTGRGEFHVCTSSSLRSLAVPKVRLKPPINDDDDRL